MQHETATVKKVIKKYTTKTGEKESISYTAKLTPDSEFDNGDIVAVIPINEIDAIADVDADTIDNLENTVADKEKIIAANNESIVNFKAEIETKTDKIVELSKEIKALKNTVADLESDISESNKTTATLSTQNDMLHERLDDLSDLLTGKDATIDELDAAIVDYKIKIAEYDAIDVDKLKEKSDELDDVKNELNEVNKRLNNKSNAISLLQNQMMELNQLVAYKDKQIDKLKNKGVLDTLFKKDVTADIPEPTLFLIDESGNVIKKDKNVVDVDATDVGDEKDSSGDDDIVLI